MIDDDKIPNKATVAIWITDQGLESNRTTLSFDELIRMLLTLENLCCTVVNITGTKCYPLLTSKASVFYPICTLHLPESP